jgi:YidC/Oxa1 family membrane protein insertase
LSTDSTSFIPDDLPAPIASGLAKTPDQLGYLKSLGLDFGWGTSTVMESLIEAIHVFSGTHWWASIALTVLIVRGIQFPFYMRMSDNAARMKEVSPLLGPLAEKMKLYQQQGDQMGMAEAMQERKRINQAAGVSNAWLAFPLTQIPIFFGAYKTLRSMAELPVPELTHQGIAWFTDLSVADPFVALPLATAALISAQIAVCWSMANMIS